MARTKAKGPYVTDEESLMQDNHHGQSFLYEWQTWATMWKGLGERGKKYFVAWTNICPSILSNTLSP